MSSTLLLSFLPNMSLSVVLRPVASVVTAETISLVEDDDEAGEYVGTTALENGSYVVAILSDGNKIADELLRIGEDGGTYRIGAQLLVMSDTLDDVALMVSGDITGIAGHEAVVVARLPIGDTVGWPKELRIGDARLIATNTAPKLFVKDVDDNILNALGTKTFADADFRAVLRLAPLTIQTRELNTPPSTIEVSTSDATPIVFNDDTAGGEYFSLQIPRSKTLLGVVRTEYSAQFIMNWGDNDQYETTINLGNIKFVRKNAAAT